MRFFRVLRELVRLALRSLRSLELGSAPERAAATRPDGFDTGGRLVTHPKHSVTMSAPGAIRAQVEAFYEQHSKGK